MIEISKSKFQKANKKLISKTLNFKFTNDFFIGKWDFVDYLFFAILNLKRELIHTNQIQF
jgi:hypothetical protein